MSRSGVRVLWDDPVLRAVVTSMTLLILACGAINVAEVFLVKDVLHTTDTVFGIVSASWMAGMIAGSAATPRFGHDVRRLLTVMAGAEIVLTVGLIGAGVAPVWPLAAAAFVVGGVGNGALSVACRTIVTLRVPDALRGRAFGVMTGAINGASVLAFAAGGALVNAFGARAAIVGCGCAALAVALVFVGRLHRLQPATAAAAGATQELSAAR